MAAWQAEAGPEAEPEAEPEPAQPALAQREAPANWKPHSQCALPMPEIGDSYAGYVDEIRRSRKKMKMDDCPALRDKVPAHYINCCIIYG
jgi:hypothetical protein